VRAIQAELGYVVAARHGRGAAIPALYALRAEVRSVHDALRPVEALMPRLAAKVASVEEAKFAASSTISIREAIGSIPQLLAAASSQLFADKLSEDSQDSNPGKEMSVACMPLLAELAILCEPNMLPSLVSLVQSSLVGPEIERRISALSAQLERVQQVMPRIAHLAEQCTHTSEAHAVALRVACTIRGIAYVIPGQAVAVKSQSHIIRDPVEESRQRLVELHGHLIPLIDRLEAIARPGTLDVNPDIEAAQIGEVAQRLAALAEVTASVPAQSQVRELDSNLQACVEALENVVADRKLQKSAKVNWKSTAQEQSRIKEAWSPEGTRQENGQPFLTDITTHHLGDLHAKVLQILVEGSLEALEVSGRLGVVVKRVHEVALCLPQIDIVNEEPKAGYDKRARQTLMSLGKQLESMASELGSDLHHSRHMKANGAHRDEVCLQMKEVAALLADAAVKVWQAAPGALSAVNTMLTEMATRMDRMVVADVEFLEAKSGNANQPIHLQRQAAELEGNVASAQRSLASAETGLRELTAKAEQSQAHMETKQSEQKIAATEYEFKVASWEHANRRLESNKEKQRSVLHAGGPQGTGEREEKRAREQMKASEKVLTAANTDLNAAIKIAERNAVRVENARQIQVAAKAKLQVCEDAQKGTEDMYGYGVRDRSQTREEQALKAWLEDADNDLYDEATLLAPDVDDKVVDTERMHKLRNKSKQDAFLELAKEEAQWAHDEHSRESLIRTILYDAIDKNKSGLISKEELHNFMCSDTVEVDGKHLDSGSPQTFDSKEFTVIWNQVDTDGDGWVDRDEFLTLYIYFHSRVPSWVTDVSDQRYQKKKAELAQRILTAAKSVQTAQQKIDEERRMHGPGPNTQALERALSRELAVQDRVRQEVAASNKRLEDSVAERSNKLKEHLSMKRQLKRDQAEQAKQQEQARLSAQAQEGITNRAHWITHICLRSVDLPERNPAPAGWSYVPKNLAQHSGAKKAIYLCYKRTEGEAPITGLQIAADGCDPPAGYLALPENLGGKLDRQAMWLCYTRTEDFGPSSDCGFSAAPLTDIQAICSETIMGVQYTEKAPPGYVTLSQDLNKEAGYTDQHHEGRIPQIYLCFAQDGSKR